MKEKLDKNDMTLRLKKITKQLICNHQISKNELSGKRSLQEKGITLIALVVTIIILLILAGVTLNIALSDNGLFSKTQEAAEKYKQAQSDEEEMVRQIATKMYSEYVGATVTGYTPTSKTEGCTVGTDDTGYESSQKFETDDMDWRVWDFDGNTLRIIGDPTSKELYLSGAAGYNNGVETINHICSELYSNEEKGAIATNLKRTDIQKVSTYDYTKYRHNSTSSNEVQNEEASKTIQFGEAREIENAQYPEMWDKNDKNWTYEWNDDGTTTGTDKECRIWEKTIENGEEKIKSGMLGGTSKIKFKQSFYRHIYNKNEFIDDEYFNLIFKTYDGSNVGDTLLASRSTLLSDTNCVFCMDTANNTAGSGCVTVHGLVSTTQDSDETFNYKLRPIVSIDLSANDYKMTTSTDANGKMTVTLT